ncbi:MAG TPA: undecaprenyl-diphosphate phosphatase [Verrucomicrobiota bacterium]|nr:undecaprenyl-diphosphate phosphatase [Verrucomicrobiales bacterium]HRI14733.1 undecaprenyl-diphosphate phosphatase [Verrucomicrobiota bacterium]
MRTYLLAFLLAATELAGLPQVSAPAAETSAPPERSAPAAELRRSDAIILGLLEGASEFIPVSSTGHLIIATDQLDLNSNQPIFDAAGQPMWYREPSETSGGELLTLNLATQAYIVVIQVGAIAAVVPVCWSQLMAMWRGLRGRDPAGVRLLVNVALAFVPSAILGLLLHDWIDEHLYSVGAVIFALVAGSLLMFYAEHRRKKRALQGRRESTELTPIAAVGIGVLQCLAMWPGTSRPMMTIVGGYFAGLNPGRSAGFSFLLGFVTLSAAVVYKGYKSGPVIVQVFGWQNVVLGALVAMVTAAITVRFLVRFLLLHGLAPFAWYRLALAGLLGFLYYL